MKNLMVANYRPGATLHVDQLKRLLDAQVDNSLRLGWNPDDVIVVANFPYERMGVTVMLAPLNEGCLRGSKTFAVDFLFREGKVDPKEVYWAHDLDAWQNHWFESPEFADVGITKYGRAKFAGASVFYRFTARDIVAEVIRLVNQSGAQMETPALNQVFRSPAYRHRVTILNSRFNLGCAGFVRRYGQSIRPILVCHMRPGDRTAWDRLVNDRDNLREPATSASLAEFLTRRFHHGVPPARLERPLRRRRA